jgi:rSAM/selenodomain-associated transferase 1
MQFADARILIFAKAPAPGLAKTRLIPVLGAEGAARLQGRLLQRVVSELTSQRLCPVFCLCAPNTDHPLFNSITSHYPVELQPQSEGDLGERMYQAACSALRYADQVILVGSDCPVLSADYVLRAMEKLQRGADAVVGPAEDGGYVLLGLKRIALELFADVPWGSAQVLAMTRRRLQGLGWNWAELEMLWDVDRPEDLDRLFQSDCLEWTPAGGGDAG